MSIGAGILLFAIGAILVFAVNVEVEWVDLDMVGYILMGAGFVVFVIGLILMLRRRETRSVSQRTVGPDGSEEVTKRMSDNADGTI